MKEGLESGIIKSDVTGRRWNASTLAGMRVVFHCCGISTNPTSIVEGNELSCFVLKRLMRSRVALADSTGLCEPGAGQKWEQIVVSSCGPFDFSGPSMSQDLLSTQVSQSSENVSSCSRVTKRTAREVTSKLLQWLDWLLLVHLAGAKWRWGTLQATYDNEPYPMFFGFQIFLCFIYITKKSEWSQRCLATPLPCALQTLLLNYPSLSLLSLSHFLSLWVVNKSEAPEDRTVNSTHLTKDITRSMNIAFSVGPDNTFIT